MNNNIHKTHKFLKWELIFLSFSPLFLLSCIRYSSKQSWFFLPSLIKSLKNNTSIDTTNLCPAIIVYSSLLLMIIAFLFYLNLKLQEITAYDDYSRPNITGKDITSDSLLFFLTYIIPFAMSDIESINELACYIIVLIMMIMLLYNTNLYYQNPILALMGYKVYEFILPQEDNQLNKLEKPIIGIQRGTFDNTKKFKIKLIADNVYMIINN